MGKKRYFLSEGEIFQLLEIMGNFSHKGKIDMKNVIHVLYLFEDKDKTEKRAQRKLKNFGRD